MRAVIIDTTSLLTLSVLLYFLQPQTNQWLAYYHSGIENGQLWRLITGHICHTNLSHLILNSVGLLVTISLFIDSFKNKSLLMSSLFSSLFISICLFIFNPSIEWYMGLSGILHALFSIGVCDELQKNNKWGYILGIGLLLKLLIEQLIGPMHSTELLILANVSIDAHLYGAIAGIIYFLFLLAKNKYYRFQK
ncbi:rhombosortase [Psychromonas sp. RZ22]|uniref:rhombosortase n=1 Tax=Psychromonas algarum TaxID=2555643 RepID=UPI001067985B|nr:rhombosortase [Psychromonas sp. RZ22]TEW53432.1 rhombosortase [Psychromonas sp. RZ22]